MVKFQICRISISTDIIAFPTIYIFFWSNELDNILIILYASNNKDYLFTLL